MNVDSVVHQMRLGNKKRNTKENTSSSLLANVPVEEHVAVLDFANYIRPKIDGEDVED